jgi:hypothetical protein
MRAFDQEEIQPKDKIPIKDKKNTRVYPLILAGLLTLFRIFYPQSR